MEIRKLINILLIILLVSCFLFEIIPLPVQNVEGTKNIDEYIFGGFYWTSLSYELGVENYEGTSLFVFSFLPLFYLNNILRKE